MDKVATGESLRLSEHVNRLVVISPREFNEAACNLS